MEAIVTSAFSMLLIVLSLIVHFWNKGKPRDSLLLVISTLLCGLCIQLTMISLMCYKTMVLGKGFPLDYSLIVEDLVEYISLTRWLWVVSGIVSFYIVVRLFLRGGEKANKNDKALEE